MTNTINSKFRTFAIAAVAAIGLLATASVVQACGPHNLVIVKTGPATVNPGDVITYTLRASALKDTTGVAQDVTVLDKVPAGLVFRPQDTTFAAAGLQRAIPSCKLEGKSVVCSLGGFSSDVTKGVQHMDISLSFDVPKSLECTTLKNVATISARERADKGEKELNPKNNISKTIVTKVACPTPTPTPTPTPEPKNPGIDVEKTDHRDITRPGHTLSYSIEVENTGEKDLHDVKITDEVPSELIITAASDGGSISGQTVTWSGISLEVDQKKSFTITTKVRDTAKNGHILHNVVTAKSDDNDVSDEATDDTRVEQLEVKGTTVVIPTPTPVAVPVTAKTGAGIVGIVSLLTGAGGLVFLKRSY